MLNEDAPGLTSDTNPAAASRSAMRDLLKRFTETLGDEAGAAALKTAVERARSEGTRQSPRRSHDRMACS